ncbi:hypothetical protein [Stackebrandtia soli]|uniref:hypothetical protein n=1 Tax=Stackebrandtia soli TaxID=1892856 RepID=UPI0039E8C0BD
MNDDIKRALGSALDTSGPPPVVDIDALERAGSRMARRRALSMAGGATAAIAAVTAGVLAMTSVFAGADPNPTTPENDTAATTAPLEFPELDPDRVYMWSGIGPNETDDTSIELRAALVAYLDTRYPDWQAIGSDDGQEVLIDPSSATVLDFGRIPSGLMEMPVDLPDVIDLDDFEVVLEAPIYQFVDSLGDPLARYSGVGVALDGTGETVDSLTIAAMPAGSYLEGNDEANVDYTQPINGHLLRGCETFDITDAHEGTGDDRRFSFDCDTVTVDGLTIERVTDRETYTAGDVTIVRHTVVVHQPNGTAMRISVAASQPIGWEQGQGAPESPSISLDDLTDLAMALPVIDF